MPQGGGGRLPPWFSEKGKIRRLWVLSCAEVIKISFLNKEIHALIGLLHMYYDLNTSGLGVTYFTHEHILGLYISCICIHKHL